MIDILEMTRELAIRLQSDQRYIKAQLAQSAADEDEQLQELIGKFETKRMELGSEMAKENRDNEKIQQLDSELREIYAEMKENKSMVAYKEAKGELDRLVKYMVAILTATARGEDPYSVTEPGCGGSCSSCAGCH